MEKVLLIIVVASELCTISSHAGRQFYFVNEAKNWTEARSYCREQYTDLATIDNMEDVNVLEKMKHKVLVWTGLRRSDMFSWIWSLPNSSFYKHGEMEFRKWSPGEPDEGENCGLMNDNGLWNETSCEGLFKAVCCDVRGSHVTYHLTSNNMSWTEAQSFCREKYTDLVSVRNNAENEKVKELVPPGTSVWIGLFRDAWKWTDGSNSSFRFWAEDQPNPLGGREDCVLADFIRSGKCSDYYCYHVIPFICYNLTEELAPPTVMTRQVFRLRLHVEDSGQDLDDTAMMEALMKQVKQKLKEQGLEHVKVSFRKQADGKFFTKEEKETEKKNDEL